LGREAVWWRQIGRGKKGKRLAESEVSEGRSPLNDREGIEERETSWAIRIFAAVISESEFGKD
jgi:hypothetical protein